MAINSINELLKGRRRQLLLVSSTSVILVGIIVLLVNVLSSWFYIRLDLTHTHAYSLSSASKRLVRSLDDRVIVKAYFTPDLPSPYNAYGRYLKDLLTEYRAASHGRLRFEFVPTQPPEAFEKTAMEAGLVPIQFEEMGSSQFQVRRGFMGLVLFYRDHTEIVPVIKNVENLEYEITSRLARMAAHQKKMIAVAAGHNELEWLSPQSKMAQDLQQLFDFQEFNLTTASGPIHADALMVAGPGAKLDDHAAWVVDQTLMSGVPTVFILNFKRFDLQRFMAFPQPTGLEDLFKHYGIKLGDQLIYDAQCETVNMTQNIGGFAFSSPVRYPYLILSTQFDTSSPLVRGLTTLAVPFASPVDAMLPLPTGVRYKPLMMSSSHSWLAPTNSYSVSPANIPNPTPTMLHGPYVLGGVFEGTFRSAFQGKPLPTGVTGALIGFSPRTSLVVIGSTEILDPNLPDMPGVETLMTNMLASLSHDDTLVGIQTKGAIIRPLKPISGKLQMLVKWGSVLGVPLFPILLGIGRWRSRERWRGEVVSAFVASKSS